MVVVDCSGLDRRYAHHTVDRFAISEADAKHGHVMRLLQVANSSSPVDLAASPSRWVSTSNKRITWPLLCVRLH